MNEGELDIYNLLDKQISMDQFGTIKVSTIIWLFLIGALIFGFFWVLRKYVVPYLSSRKAVKKANTLRYRLEILSWGLYSVFAVYQLLTDSLYITVILLLLLILAGRNFWRDLFAGIAFKLENKFSVKDPVRFEDHNGNLDKIGSRNIQIKTDSEELVIIPFRKLSGSVFIKRQAKGKLHSSKLSMNTGSKSPEEVVQNISDWLYQCPWAVVNEKVSPKITGAKELTFTIYAVDVASISKTEDYIKKRLNKLS
ncbi:MAG: hypothetical protein ACI857_001887 [Arenicella sp.]|jgi:hypothetical protein